MPKDAFKKPCEVLSLKTRVGYSERARNFRRQGGATHNFLRNRTGILFNRAKKQDMYSIYKTKLGWGL